MFVYLWLGVFVLILFVILSCFAVCLAPTMLNCVVVAC